MHQTSLPATGLYGRDGLRKYLTPPERQRFMRTAWLCRWPRTTTLCLVLAYCGCRLSEALALRAHDIDVEGRSIAFRSLKKRGQIVVREVPVPGFLVRVLPTAHAEAFASDARLWPWSRSHAWLLVKSVMIEAAVATGPHQTAKGLRHAFAIHAIRSGVPLDMVQRWLGHASIATTAIYTQALGAEERELAERMWN